MDAFKELKELLLKDRSIRRFDASQSIDIDTLRNLVDPDALLCIGSQFATIALSHSCERG